MRTESEDIEMKATIFWSNNAPIDEGYGLIFGKWTDAEPLTLQGFATMHDAWVFAVAHTMIDPCPFGFDNRWKNNPPEPEVCQLPMFT